MCRLRILTLALLISLSVAFFVPAHALAGRFVNNNDGTVSDSLTGWMWQQSDDGIRRIWERALFYCESLNLAGYTDWRLPDYRELESIVDYDRYYPAIDPVFHAVSSQYWSATSSVYGTRGAWAVGFDVGLDHWGLKSGAHYVVRCTRGGPSELFGSLGVTKTGTGTGTVTSRPAGINCGQTCSSKFHTGTQVILSAAANAGSVFEGWSGGGCSGTGTCTVVLSDDVSVTAAFARVVYSISGSVKTKAGAPIPGVTVALSGAATKSAVTDGSGKYGFSDLSNGAYTLTPAKDQYTFEPSQRSVNINGNNVAGQDFAGMLQTGALNVVIIPSAVVTAGAGWKVDNGSWNKSGATVSGLTVGAHTVSCKDIPPGWITPANRTVSITKNKTTTLTVKYTPALRKYSLTVSKTGAGKGKVTSSPAGINCGTDCTEIYNEGRVVTLTAAAGAGSTFKGWSGTVCTGTDRCTVTMNADTTVTADFAPATAQPDLVIVSVTGPSTGTVGQSIRVFGTVKNQGNRAADAFKTGLYLSKDMVITTKDQLLETIDQCKMAPGDKSGFSKEVAIPTTTKTGAYYIGAIADVEGTVAESDEADNSKAYAKQIKIVSPKADLVVHGVSSIVDTEKR